jgi:hypothetical protein
MWAHNRAGRCQILILLIIETGPYRPWPVPMSTRLLRTVDEINAIFSGIAIGCGNLSARAEVPNYQNIHHRSHMT